MDGCETGIGSVLMKSQSKPHHWKLQLHGGGRPVGPHQRTPKVLPLHIMSRSPGRLCRPQPSSNPDKMQRLVGRSLGLQPLPLEIRNVRGMDNFVANTLSDVHSSPTPQSYSTTIYKSSLPEVLSSWGSYHNTLVLSLCSST